MSDPRTDHGATRLDIDAILGPEICYVTTPEQRQAVADRLAALDVPPQGQEAFCCLCFVKVDHLAANPSLWPVEGICYVEEPGVARIHCLGCVTKRMNEGREPAAPQATEGPRSSPICGSVSHGLVCERSATHVGRHGASDPEHGGRLTEWETTSAPPDFTPAAEVRQTLEPSECKHEKRRPYEPEFSTGDESDYESICRRCGMLLRMPPTGASQ